MPAERLSMRRIREVLRLRHQGLTERVIARTLGVSNGVVHGYVRRARQAGLSWSLPEGMDDEGLELLLLLAPAAASRSEQRPTPDWAFVEKELRRRSVTRLLLWEEYRAANPDGFGYTWFCTTFEAWKKRARPSMRQTHIGGEKVFVEGLSLILCGRPVQHQQTNLSPKATATANCVLASIHSRGGRFHSSAALLRTKYSNFIAASSLGKCPLARIARRSLAFSASIAFVV
jgi:hypothetical protein